jgi:hypothetical protein
MGSGIEKADEIATERNERWKDAWSEWDFITYVDMIIAKSKRILNCVDIADFYSVEDSAIDCLNYAKELKKKLKEAKI